MANVNDVLSARFQVLNAQLRCGWYHSFSLCINRGYLLLCLNILGCFESLEELRSISISRFAFTHMRELTRFLNAFSSLADVPCATAVSLGGFLVSVAESGSL